MVLICFKEQREVFSGEIVNTLHCEACDIFFCGCSNLTRQKVLCVQEFTVDLSLQFVGLVSVLGQSSLPVHSALTQPASVESVRAHPQ